MDDLLAWLTIVAISLVIASIAVICLFIIIKLIDYKQLRIDRKIKRYVYEYEDVEITLGYDINTTWEYVFYYRTPVKDYKISYQCYRDLKELKKLRKLDNDGLMSALYLAQEVIHNEKHTCGTLNDNAYNTCLVTIQYLLDKLEEQGIYEIEEDISEMLDRDRRFMAYEYKNIKGE